MAIHAYPETYLNDAMNNLGDMLDYAVNDCGYDASDFFDRFIISGVAKSFEKGSPKYVAGLSGPELASEVIYRTQGERLHQMVSDGIDKSPEYWAGWILAYYQWYRNERFSDLKWDGLDISKVLSLYNPLHEADPSKFVSVADGILQQNRARAESNLQQLRKQIGMTQKELAATAEVALRMVQLYEQRRQDIRKAEAATILRLAGVLGCEVEDLMEGEQLKAVNRMRMDAQSNGASLLSDEDIKAEIDVVRKERKG